MVQTGANDQEVDVPSEPQPTARRRRLGNELRTLREAADLSPRAVADRLGCDVTKISRIELGRSGVRKLDLETMLDLFELNDQTKRRALHALSRESRKKTWWHQYSDILRPSTQDLLILESEAETILSFEPTLVPGLLQTESYARALITGGAVVSDAEGIEARVKLRMERKQIFDQQEPPQLIAVIDESALHRMIGGAKVMAGQLRHLTEMCRPPGLTIQVVPRDLGAYPGIEGPFCVMSYPDDVGLDMAFLDQRYSGLWLEDGDHVRLYRSLHDHLRALALSCPQSTALIERLADDIEQ